MKEAIQEKNIMGNFTTDIYFVLYNITGQILNDITKRINDKIGGIK